MPKRKKSHLPFDPKIIQAAFSLYLQGKTVNAISREMGLGYTLVAHWAGRYGWHKQREEIREEKQKALADRYKDFQEEHFDDVLARQMDISTKIDGHVLDQLGKKKVGVRALEGLSRAAAQSAGISSKLIGLDKYSEEKRKPLLIQVGVQVLNEQSGSAPVAKIQGPAPTLLEAEPVCPF